MWQRGVVFCEVVLARRLVVQSCVTDFISNAQLDISNHVSIVVTKWFYKLKSNFTRWTLNCYFNTSSFRTSLIKWLLTMYMLTTICLSKAKFLSLFWLEKKNPLNRFAFKHFKNLSNIKHRLRYAISYPCFPLLSSFILIK